MGIDAFLNVKPQEENDLSEDQVSLEKSCFYIAVELRSEFESVIPTWKEPGALMALAKLSARTGHVDWAMDCVEKLVEGPLFCVDLVKIGLG